MFDLRLLFAISFFLFYQGFKDSELPEGGIKIFAILLHTHLAGKNNFVGISLILSEEGQSNLKLTKTIRNETTHKEQFKQLNQKTNTEPTKTRTNWRRRRRREDHNIFIAFYKFVRKHIQSDVFLFKTPLSFLFFSRPQNLSPPCEGWCRASRNSQRRTL